MSPVRVRLSAPLTNPAFAGFLILGGSGENRRFGTERSAVKGAQQNHQEHRDWVDFVWKLYSPVIRPITTRHPNGVFFIELFRILWYNIRVSRTTLVVFFIARICGCFLFNKRSYK